MKWLFLLFLPSVASSQINNFSLQDKEIIWTQTFSTNLSLTEFTKAIKQSGLFTEINLIDSTFSGRTINITPDYKGAGYSAMRTPSYLINDYVKAFALITYKDSEYQVLLKQITIVASSDLNAGFLSHKMGQETALELYAANNKRTELRGSFPPASKILDYTFERKFAVH